MARPLTPQPFDVVVVPFPYGDAAGAKRRPAVVVCNAALGVEQGRLWLAMVTSAPGPAQRGDAPITDLAAAGLAKACRVRGAKLATLDLAQVLGRPGTLAEADRTALRSALAACMGW